MVVKKKLEHFKGIQCELNSSNKRMKLSMNAHRNLKKNFFYKTKHLNSLL